MCEMNITRCVFTSVLEFYQDSLRHAISKAVNKPSDIVTWVRTYSFQASSHKMFCLCWRRIDWIFSNSMICTWPTINSANWNITQTMNLHNVFVVKWLKNKDCRNIINHMHINITWTLTLFNFSFLNYIFYNNFEFRNNF